MTDGICFDDLKPGIKRVITLTIACLICILLAAGCSQNQKSENERSKTAVIGITSDLDSFLTFSTATSDALHIIEEMLFLSLFKMDENLELKPSLAEEWEFSEDLRELTFRLRDDVQWSDGVATTAHDVLFTYELAINPETGYAAISRFDQVDSVIVIDDQTIRFRFNTAYPDALLDLQFSILPKHVLKDISPAELKSCSFNRQPVGNGPFVLKEWLSNDQIVFAANEHYYADRPQLDQIIFRIIPDETILRANLLAGEIDLIPYYPHRFTQEIRGNPNFRILNYPERGYSFMAFNLNRSQFQDRSVRQAIAKAINRQQMIDALLYGNGRVTYGPIMPYFWAFDESLAHNDYDPEEARRLLTDAGWVDRNDDGIREKNGRDLSFSLKTNSNNRVRSDAIIMIQEDLRKVGVKVTPMHLEWGTLLDEVLQRRDFDALLLAWKTSYKVDPSSLWHSDAIENGYNLPAYRSDTVDSLLAAARVETDRDRARSIWSEFQQKIIEDSPYVFLFTQEYTAAMKRELQNVEMDVRGYLISVEKWTKTESKQGT